MPEFTEEMSPGERQRALADYILDTARMRGELAELRMTAHTELYLSMIRYRSLEGWGRYRRRDDGSGKSAEDAAKRRMDPELSGTIERAKFTIARCTEEMDRLGGSDYEAASRAYTILTGS